MIQIVPSRTQLDDSGRDHRPLSDHTIIGDDIDELISFSLERIIPKSRSFYAKELKNDLEATGRSIIDVHAGMGMFYNVVLNHNEKGQLKIF